MKNLNLRLEEDLHARIKAAAAQADRSLQQQIIHLLKTGLDAPLVHLTRGRPSWLPNDSQGEGPSDDDSTGLRRDRREQ